MSRRAAVSVLAAVALLSVAGCNDGAVPSAPPQPARPPRPPADDIARTLDGYDDLMPLFRAWHADVESVPFPPLVDLAP